VLHTIITLSGLEKRRTTAKPITIFMFASWMTKWLHSQLTKEGLEFGALIQVFALKS
jgi:hypothetical protein